MKQNRVFDKIQMALLHKANITITLKDIKGRSWLENRHLPNSDSQLVVKSTATLPNFYSDLQQYSTWRKIDPSLYNSTVILLLNLINISFWDKEVANIFLAFFMTQIWM
jgi:hypothetical protein